MTARIAMGEAINTHLNSRAAGTVLQGIDPIAVDLSLFNAHGLNVADRLHLCKYSESNWALDAFDFCGTHLAECDGEIEARLQGLQAHDGEPAKGK